MTYNPISTLQLNLLERYRSIRQTTVSLCAPLEREDYVVQPIVDVSPPKWHLGHSTWFFENFILAPHVPEYKLFDERLNWFFNSYYESQGPRITRSKRGNMTRPALEKVLAYRKYVDEHIERFFKGSNLGNQSELLHFMEIGLQHEQQHQELLATDIKYILGHNPLYPVYNEATLAHTESDAAVDRFTKVEEGIYEIGHEGEGFAFDNEFGRHKVFLHAFEIRNSLVSNREYLEFINAGGYQDFQHWLMEGIEWARKQELKAPLYWYLQDGTWYQYTLQGLKPLDLDAPVTHICYYEADAYARWKGLRLPTEFEWEVACNQISPTIPEDGNFQESKNFHPVAPQSDTDYQFLGNTWEWTSSAYLPYPNYPRLKGALGEYNGKFMVNQMVLRGGSCATPKSHIRKTYRNFFHADKQFQFTGIRLAK